MRGSCIRRLSFLGNKQNPVTAGLHVLVALLYIINPFILSGRCIEGLILPTGRRSRHLNFIHCCIKLIYFGFKIIQLVLYVVFVNLPLPQKSSELFFRVVVQGVILEIIDSRLT